jgi:hypothetical protein
MATMLGAIDWDFRAILVTDAASLVAANLNARATVAGFMIFIVHRCIHRLDGRWLARRRL